MTGHLLFVFGHYAGDFTYSDGIVDLRLERSATVPRYVRACGRDRVEKILPSGEGDIVINPVEPVNLPEQLTRYLEITFPPLVIPPRKERQIFLTFPLEIGVFFAFGSDLHVLDMFSCVSAKYSLYGSPAAGQITRWHRSGIFGKVPSVDRLSYGVLDLTIRNLASETIEVARTILDSGNMHLFYGEHVSMAALMEVYSPMIARTSVMETAPAAGMRQSIELYIARRIPPVHGSGHLMEFGVA